MNTHIVLLRGINVSGKNIIKMAELRQALSSGGFEHPKTYIQTGNIVLKTTENASDTSKRVAQIIEEKFNLTVPTLTINASDIATAFTHNPFGLESALNKTTYFGFMWAAPSVENIATLQTIDYPPEEVSIHHNIVYLHSPNGAGKAKITHALLERKLGVKVTIRNYNTLKKLLEMSQE